MGRLLDLLLRPRADLCNLGPGPWPLLHCCWTRSWSSRTSWTRSRSARTSWRWSCEGGRNLAVFGNQWIKFDLTESSPNWLKIKLLDNKSCEKELRLPTIDRDLIHWFHITSELERKPAVLLCTFIRHSSAAQFNLCTGWPFRLCQTFRWNVWSPLTKT